MIRVGILRGGVGSDYRHSLESGGRVISHFLEHFPREYRPVDMLVDKDGEWHVGGIPASMSKIRNSVDLIFNALHEDSMQGGRIHKALEDMELPYIGSEPVSSSISGNYFLAKKIVAPYGVKVLNHVDLSPFNNQISVNEYAKSEAERVLGKFSPPWSIRSGNSIVASAGTLPELINKISDLSFNIKNISVEELIKGKEASVSIIDGFRGEDMYVLPEAQKVSENVFVSPGRFSRSEKDKIAEVARILYKAFGARHFGSIHFIIDPKGGICFSGFSSSPRLGENSPLEASLRSVGSSLKDFLRHIIGISKK